MGVWKFVGTIPKERLPEGTILVKCQNCDRKYIDTVDNNKRYPGHQKCKKCGSSNIRVEDLPYLGFDFRYTSDKKEE